MNARWTILAVVLNSLDAVLTRLAILNGATELNPLMALLLALGTYQFLVYKLIVINSLVIAVAVIGRNNPVTTKGLMIACVLYFTVVSYHMLNLFLVWSYQ